MMAVEFCFDNRDNVVERGPGRYEIVGVRDADTQVKGTTRAILGESLGVCRAFQRRAPGGMKWVLPMHLERWNAIER